MLAAYMGVEHAVIFNSGTSAQYAVLRSHGIDSGEVIVPSFTFISTVNTIALCGAKPVFADIEDRTMGLSAEDVNERITRRTKAIVPVHYAGAVCRDIKALRELSEDHGCVLIEDAAESMGATIDGAKAGTIGHSSILSFCQNKVITTGEGGAICTNDASVANAARLIRSHGRDERVGEDYFTTHRKMDYVTTGFNFRMPTINAALGIAQLEKIDGLIAMRRANAEALNGLLGRIPGIGLPMYPGNISSVYQLYPIVLGSREERDGLKAHLEGKGIASKVYFDPVHLEKYYREAYPGTRLEVTESIAGRVLSLPFYPHMPREEMEAVFEAVKGYLG
jgi:predicted outer membrane repeat protein